MSGRFVFFDEITGKEKSVPEWFVENDEYQFYDQSSDRDIYLDEIIDKIDN